MENIEILKKLQEQLNVYNDFSSITYETKYLEIFNKIFGEESKFTKKANSIVGGWCVKGAIERVGNRISDAEFNRNQHEEFVLLLQEAIEFLEIDVSIEKGEKAVKKKIFIVHGHDNELKYQLSEWLRAIDIEPIILHEQANGGIISILDKLNKYSDVDCAIALFTADDVGSEKEKKKELKWRARQNVVFEAGLFLGKLGKEKVIMLYDEDIEVPSDLNGLIYIMADKYGGWKEQLRKEFKELNIKAD